MMNPHNKPTWYLISRNSGFRDLCGAVVVPDRNSHLIVHEHFRAIVKRDGYEVTHGSENEFEKWCAACVIYDDDDMLEVGKYPDGYIVICTFTVGQIADDAISTANVQIIEF